MTRSSERFMKRLAELLTESSKADWDYAATHLEELAIIARSLSSVASKKTKNRKATSTPAPTKHPKITVSENAQSPQVAALADYLRTHPELTSTPRLRMIATIIGVKSDLPATKASGVEMLAQQLESLPEATRSKRIHQVMDYLHKEGTDQSEEFKRWVSLIVKR